VTVSSPSTAPAETVAADAIPKRPAAALLDHEYDGIREYDNPLPGWWLKILWGSIAFSFGYLVYFGIGNGLSVHDAYEQEMAIVRAEQAQRALGESVSEEGLAKLMLDAKLMGDAKALFTQRCVVCHGEHAQGVIGPNLTDAYWLHGKGTLLDIHQTVSEGVPAKGMPSWKMQLSPVQVRELAAFVGTLRGTNVPGKAPDGTLVEAAKKP
jgi:cytochrome c oxidase cbb3-type subunit 3